MLAILTTHPIQYQVPLWQALAREGKIPFEVWYLTAHGTKSSYDEQFGKSFSWDIDTLSGYQYRFLDVNENANVSSFTKLRLKKPLEKLFYENKVTALWIQGWQVFAYWQAVRQAHISKIPVWLRGESNDLGHNPAGKRLVKQLVLGQLFDRVKNFLYIGAANRRLYESFGVKSDQLHPAPYCVDNDRFTRQADALLPERADIRRQWGIPENAFCILFAGKFIPKKRPHDIITAMQDVRWRNFDRPVHLLFVGSGQLGEELKKNCHVVFDQDSTDHSYSRHRDDRKPAASFTGFLNQTEISKAYVAADCLVLPSDPGETWGLVVNEALAQRAAVHCQ